jgi:hypothetical protein
MSILVRAIVTSEKVAAHRSNYLDTSVEGIDLPVGTAATDEEHRRQEPSGLLSTSQVVILDEPHPPVELETIATSPSHLPPRRPCLAWVAMGPRTIGNPRSPADNSGKQTPRSELKQAIHRSSRQRPSSTFKATVDAYPVLGVLVRVRAVPSTRCLAGKRRHKGPAQTPAP